MAPSALGIRRILLIKWSALGDAALASVAVEDLRRAFPEARMDLDTLPPAAALFAFDPRFDQVIALPMRDRKRRLRRHLSWLRRVRAAHYDLVVDLQSSDHTRLLLALLSCGRRRVPQRWGLRRGFPYTLAPPAHSGKNPLERMRMLLAAGGVPTTTTMPVLHPHPDQRARVGTLLSRFGVVADRHAVFLPGSQAGGWLKRWSVANYAELAVLLHARGIERVLVIGALDEADACRGIVALANARVPGLAVYLDALMLLEIIPACANAAVVVANDTGSAHVAAAAGRPLWVLCGPTDPLRVRPAGPRVRALQAEQDCLACYRKTCRWGDRPVCMERIEPRAVLALCMGDAAEMPGLRVIDELDARGQASAHSDDGLPLARG